VQYVLWATAVLVLGLTGCSADETSDESGGFPIGRFAEDDNANHVFEFHEDGTYLYDESDFVGGDPDVAGMYGVSGDLYTEMTHDYSGARHVPATYHWTYDGQNLTFELEGEDVISHRKGVYDGQTYVKSD